MKAVFFVFIFVSSLFSFDNIYNTLKECSEIKDDTQRLNCYDSFALTKKPKSLLEIQGEKLTNSCLHCHGKNWELSTNGERLVKDMSEKEIFDSLMAYKLRQKRSVVMNFHMGKYSNKEIETMAKYISHLFKLKN